MKEFMPNIIIGYPSAVKILAELVEKGEVKVNAVRVISCGEPLGASLRSYLEKSFGAKVVNFYGASESLTMGVEMKISFGLKIFTGQGNFYIPLPLKAFASKGFWITSSGRLGKTHS